MELIIATQMHIVTTRWVRTSASAKMDIMEMEQPALVRMINYI